MKKLRLLKNEKSSAANKCVAAPFEVCHDERRLVLFYLSSALK